MIEVTHFLSHLEAIMILNFKGMELAHLWKANNPVREMSLKVSAKTLSLRVRYFDSNFI